MYIERLIVKKMFPVEKEIRNIKFNKEGLNLITDITSNVPTDTGNSVGKSTVIKIIDFCLGASTVTRIYKDNDTNTKNELIESFLKNNKVRANLVLLNTDNNRTTFSRDLFQRGKCYIDNVKLSNINIYKDKLKEYLFSFNCPKPTLRELIPRFVRTENKQLENIITYLHTNTSNSTYETIHLFLINPDNSNFLSEKELVEKSFNDALSNFNTFKNENNITSDKELLEKNKLIQIELNQKNNLRSKIDYIDIYKEELEKKSDITNKINLLSTEIDNLEFDISLSRKSIDTLKEEKVSINMDLLHEIYDESTKYLKNVNKDFEELIIFHNSMIDNRLTFISKQLSKKIFSLKELKEKQDNLLKEKQKISIELVDESLLSDLNIINSQISDLDVKKGELKKTLDMYHIYEEKFKKEKNNLKIIQDTKSEIDMQLFIDKFNKYFHFYTEKLYGNKFSFVYNSNWKFQSSEKPFTFTNIHGELGTGKKLGLIVAFDLAYLKYIDKLEFNFPKFIIHDKLENTHINQLNTIFELCSNINGQYIVPILKERIKNVSSEIIENSTILELSQTDKFFKLP